MIGAQSNMPGHGYLSLKYQAILPLSFTGAQVFSVPAGPADTAVGASALGLDLDLVGLQVGVGLADAVGLVPLDRPLNPFG